MKAIIPGSYCPITVGHIDLIKRAAAVFSEVVVALGENPDKSYLMTDEARLAYVRDAVKDIPNVSAELFCGLTVDLAQKVGADVIVKGIRDYKDMQYEQEMEYYNRRLSLDKYGKALDTLYFASAPEYSFISSSAVRMLLDCGESVEKYVHNEKLLKTLLK